MPDGARLKPHAYGRRIIALVLALAAVNAGARAQPEVLSLEPAETLFTNARVITLDPQNTIAQALVVRGNRIAFTGNNETARRHASAGARVIDAGGRAIIPGLIDSHIHAIRAGLTFSSEVSFAGARTIPEAMARVKSAATRLSKDHWIIVAGGWTEQQFAERRAPTQHEILQAAPDHAVYLQVFYRAVLMTPKGFAKLAIIHDADVPPRGVIERDGDGAPTGWIRGDPLSISALYDRLPRPDLAAQMAGTRAFFTELNRFGVTGVIDPGGLNLAPQGYRALFQLWREKQMNLRVVYSISAQRRGPELADFRAATQFLPMGAGDGMLRFNGLGEIVTWGVYNNDAPSAEQIAQFEELALWAARQRLTMTMHWNRNASIHHLLDALERVNAKASFAPLRWSIAHIHDASPQTLARMRKLNLGWLTQNAVFFAAPAFLRMRGESLRLTPPLRTAIELGLPTGAGTDAHRVMWYNPFVALQWMIDGRTVAGASTRDAEQRLTRLEALALYTRGSAWFAFDENNRGTLQAGKWADLAVLSDDYLSVPVEQISGLRSLLTMVDGRIVHEDKAISRPMPQP